MTQVAINLAGTLGGTTGDGQADTATVTGTNGNDVIGVLGAGTVVSVASLSALVNITGAEGANDAVTINALAGDDVINAATMPAGIMKLTVDGGIGSDIIIGSQGADVLRGGAGNDTLTGGDGDDQVFGDAGNDRMIWNPGDDTDLFEGGADIDTAEVNGGNGAEVFTATANGTRVRFDRLDPAPFSLDIGTTENLVLNMNGGNDSFSATGNLAALISVTVDGGAGDDTILGSNGVDVLLGGDGNDFIDGQQGNDTAFLGAGNDVFQWDPGDGSDVVEGQDGTDTLLFNGSNGDEIFQLSANGARALFTRNLGNIVMDVNDVETITVNALAGVDTFTVNDLSGTDVTQVNVNLAGTIGGTTGDNQIDQTIVNGSVGDDVVGILGQNGSLAVAGLAALVSISTSEATDVVIVKGGAGNDTLSAASLPAGNAILILDGGVGNDTILGSNDINTLLGGDGNDTLIGGAGNDAHFGGAGDDLYVVDSGGDAVIENANEGNDVVFSTANLQLSANVETLVLQGTADLQGFGNALTNSLFGNTGNNLLDGGAGTDVMVGGAGDDTYFVDNGVDAVIESAGQGNDAVFALVNYGLTANVETLVLQGTADLQGFGNTSANTLFGNSGNNLLDGGASADVMVGGAGNDTYFVDNGVDAVIESAGQGNDAVFALVNYGLTANVETLVLQGTADLQGFGNTSANTLFGNNGNNLLDGGAGADTMIGGLGNDTYFVDDAGDLVFENAGEGTDAVFSTVSHTLAANVETLVLQGASNLSGAGNALANSIFGNSGGNTLDGGAGADALTGAAGDDIFVFNVGQANGDTVVDFAGNGAGAGDSLHFVGYGAGASFTNIDATHWQVNYNGGASHDIIGFSNAAAIDVTDFLFV